MTSDAKKCLIPYHKTGKLLIFSGTILSGLAMKETPEWPEKRLAEYYNALATDGVNAERNFSTCCINPPDPWDPNAYHQFDDPEYLTVIQRRLALVKSRDLTEIMILQPYRSGISNADVRWLIKKTKQFLPNIIYEPTNEPTVPDVPRLIAIAEILLEEGIPKSNILIEFAHSGEWADFMLNGMKDGASVSHHWMGSMKTVADTFTGAAAQQILSWGGFVGSNDGPDEFNDAGGLNFRYLEEAGVDNRRPTNYALHALSCWMLENGRGYEHLSAAGYRVATVNGLSWPNMDDAIVIGREERKAMGCSLYQPI
jgi:hypothetical protein